MLDSKSGTQKAEDIMTYVKDVARAALPDKLWALLRRGRQRGRRLVKDARRDLCRPVHFRSARRALLKSDALSNDEKCLLRNVSLRVHPNDDMYLPGAERSYLSVGLIAIRCIHAALNHAPLNHALHPIRILDLPSGYGRRLRFLKVSFPRATVCACDINPEAVEFCTREFQVKSVISSQDFAKVSLPGPFDLIWSGSLLTHLAVCQATELLRLYHRHLAPRGLCVFSMHGSTSAEWIRNRGETYGLTEASRRKVLSGFDNRGYGYADYERSPGYGISIATRTRIVDMASAVGDWTFSSFFERALSDHHDVYGFTKGQTQAPLIVEARGPIPDSNIHWIL